MDQIYSITEILSIGKRTFTLGQSFYPKGENDKSVQIANIQEKIVKISGTNYDVIIGTDNLGKKLFQFRKESVNIIFL